MDCEGGNNKLGNLAWGTKSQNGRDTTKAGRRKLTYAQARQIRRLVAAGLSCSEAARQFGVLPGSAWNLVYGGQYAETP